MDRDLLKRPLHLAVLGWPLGGSQQDARQIGERVFLQPAIWYQHEDLIVNDCLIPLGPDVLRGRWVIDGYQLWDGPGPAGEKLADLPLAYAADLPHGGLGGLPPAALQFWPGQSLQPVQPVWGVSNVERNPWAAWTDRIHLYGNAQRRWECTSILYRDQCARVRSVEMFDFTLIPERLPRPRRIWIGLNF